MAQRKTIQAENSKICLNYVGICTKIYQQMIGTNLKSQIRDHKMV